MLKPKLSAPAIRIDMNDIIREGNLTLRAVAEDVTFPLSDEEHYPRRKNDAVSS